MDMVEVPVLLKEICIDSPPSCDMCLYIASNKFKCIIIVSSPPNVQNQIKMNKKGAVMVPLMNSATVLPYEILAMNIPTKGHQAIHHPQKKMVQLFIQPAGPSLISTLIGQT